MKKHTQKSHRHITINGQPTIEVDFQEKVLLIDFNAKLLGVSGQYPLEIAYASQPVFNLTEKNFTGPHLQFLDSEIA